MPRKSYLHRCSFAYKFSHIYRHTPIIRIPLLTDDLYLVHGAKHVAETLRAPALSVTRPMGIVLKHGFGMSQRAANTYLNDDAGSQKFPLPGSTTKPQDRVAYLIHELHVEGLLGNGLPPMLNRLESETSAWASLLQITDEWVQLPSLLGFFERDIATVIIRSIFGEALLAENPDFLTGLWEFDRLIMSLVQRVPIICAPRAYWLRYKLIQQIKKWHTHARTLSAHRQEEEGQDDDPDWGCKMIRDRYKTLSGAKNQDAESVASTDLAFIWA